MKKSIFLFFAAILCTMSVSAKVIYFKPNGNWAAANANFYAHVWGGSGATSPVKFTPVATDPDVYEAEIGTHNQVIFLRMNPAKTVTSSNMWTHSDNGGPMWNRMGNLSLPTEGENCCTIKDGQWTQDTNDASSYVTWSTYTPPTVVVIPDRYITGTLAGGWNANDVKMTYDEATETYSHTFTAVAANAEQKFKVTDGTWSKNWGGDAVSPAIDGITTDGDGNAVFTLSTAGDVTVTFKDSKIQVTTTGAFKVPVTYPYYILGTMNSWSVEEEYGLADEDEDGVYTREITLAAGEHFFKINIGKWDSQWGWSNVVGVYTEATDAEDDNKIKITLASEKTFTVEFNKSKNQISFDGLTKIEDYYTVVGVADLFGEAWSTKNEANKMVKQGDGSYKLVKENLTLAAIGYDWKIAKNGDWWNDAATGVNPSGGGNNTLTITTAGRYNVTFTLAANLESATVETELLEAAVVIPDCYISGNATLTGGEGWQGNEFTMVYDEETETWAYTLAGLQPEKEYELKVVCGGTWYSFANLATPVPTGITEGNDHSIAFKMAAAGDVVVTYNVEAGITLSGNFAEPVTYDYYIVGSFNGDNPADEDHGMTLDGTVYKATVTLAAGDNTLKVTDGTWDNTWGYSNLGAAYEEVSDAEEYNNIKITLAAEKEITVIFDAATDKITFDGLTPVVVTYQLKGVGGWEQPGIELVQNPDPEKPSEYMLTCQAISATDAIKVVRLEDGVITNYYGNGTVKDGVEVTVSYDADGNITLPAGTYNFYFDTNEPEKKLWIAAATDCETEPEYEVVEDVITNFAFDFEAWPMVCTGGPSTNYEIEVHLTLTEEADGTLDYEECSVAIMGTDATFIDGTLSNIDPDAPSADAVLHVLWGEEEYYELRLSMSAVASAPVDVTAVDATVTFNDNDGALKFNGTDIYGGDAVYVELAGFEYNGADEYTLNGPQISMFENKNTEAFAFANEVTVAIDEDGYVTVEGEYTSFNGGGIYNVRIGGELPKYTLTLSSNVSDATLTGSGTYYAAQEVTVTATQELPGWAFDHWSDGDEKVSTDATYTFRLGKDLELTANYLEIYTRTVAENQWGTICLPNASSSFTGATFYEVSSLDPEKGLWLDQLAAGTQLVAGKPYIFYATATEITVTYTDASPVANPVPGENGLTGTFTGIAAGGALVGNYIIAENKVWVAGASATLPANRAYIANTVPTTEQPQLPGRRRVCMGENATTGLDQIVAPEGQAVKVIENGQLIIIRDGVKYNVQGQKL